jgi:hypothetical protein
MEWYVPDKFPLLERKKRKEKGINKGCVLNFN